MNNNKTAIEWLFDETIKHNGIVPMGVIREAMAMYEEQMRAAYREGFKRCSFIKMIEGGYMPSVDEKTPDDFDTYYEKSYGE